MSVRYNTRFNPTTSGELTVGNLYTALVNATEAHRSGGKFILRVDDTQKYWLNRFGTEKVDELAGNFYQDLKEFMKIDYFYCQHVGPDITRLVDTSKRFFEIN